MIIVEKQKKRYICIPSYAAVRYKFKIFKFNNTIFTIFLNDWKNYPSLSLNSTYLSFSISNNIFFTNNSTIVSLIKTETIDWDINAYLDHGGWQRVLPLETQFEPLIIIMIFYQ